ncbi:MAG: hypothetical protein C4586_05075 [Anaerolineaceae bacterium]|nr:MAG: hypothetical protein C4586_05075 [Anaerolineaceae bacterium]
MRIKYSVRHRFPETFEKIKIKGSSGMRFTKVFLNISIKSHSAVVLLSVASLMLVSIVASVVSPMLFATILLLMGLGILRISNMNNHADFTFAGKLFTFVFCFSVILTSLLYLYYTHTFGVSYESGGTDDARFEKQAQAMVDYKVTTYEEAKNIYRLTGTGIWNSAGNYVILLAMVHKLVSTVGLEPHTLNYRLLNGFFLAMTAVLVWVIARRCCKYESTALFSGYYAGLLPSMLFVAAHTYRDVLIGFVIMLVVLLMITLPNRFSNGLLKASISIISLVLSIILLENLREGMLVIMAGMTGLMAVFQTKSLSRRVGLLLLLIVVIGVLVTLGFLDKFIGLSVDNINYYTEYKASQGSESGIATGIYRLPALLSYPFRIVYLSISPLPFPSKYISEDFRRLGTLVWFFSLPFLLRAFLTSRKLPEYFRKRYRQLVATAFLVIYLVVALTTLQARQITMFVPLGAILIAVGIERSTRSFFYDIFVMMTLGMIMVLLYLGIKFLSV